MTIHYVAIAIIGSFLAILLGSALLTGWFDKKAREERKLRADIARLQERNRRIASIFVERAGRYEPTVIEGEFRVVDDLRKGGAL